MKSDLRVCLVCHETDRDGVEVIFCPLFFGEVSFSTSSTVGEWEHSRISPGSSWLTFCCCRRQASHCNSSTILEISAFYWDQIDKKYILTESFYWDIVKGNILRKCSPKLDFNFTLDTSTSTSTKGFSNSAVDVRSMTLDGCIVICARDSVASCSRSVVSHRERLFNSSLLGFPELCTKYDII